MNLFVDVKGTLDQSERSGLNLAVRSWVEQQDMGGDRYTLTIWTSGLLEEAVAAADRFLEDIPCVFSKKDTITIDRLVDLGSDATVVDDDPKVVCAARHAGAAGYSPAGFVEMMSNDIMYVCIGCHSRYETPAHFDSPLGPLCVVCAAPPEGKVRLEPHDLIEGIEHGLRVLGVAYCIPENELMEIFARLATLKFERAMERAHSKSVSLVVPERLCG